ncbi:hypothetical protein NIIDMKKI_80480 [Mycobacterium kansasii]|uniref:Uncharacterized protein n=1 Tax=Mycobacterium kansasii TaxID=1768 RepID=A0A7G1IRK1_MYCKA|nr:hypothetical protein NIIDMKKI_80480 [Mycobacterium kansasii]
MAPASITSVVRLRWRTLSRTVGHMVRTAAALSSLDAFSGSGVDSGAGCGGVGRGGAAVSGGRAGGVGRLRAAASAGRAGGVGRLGAAVSGVAAAAGIDMANRVSIRSTRCSNADSASLADGRSSRAQITSRSKRGAVAPRISPRPA